MGSGRCTHSWNGTLRTSHPRAASRWLRRRVLPRGTSVLDVKWHGPSTSSAMRSPWSGRTAMSMEKRPSSVMCSISWRTPRCSRVCDTWRWRYDTCVSLTFFFHASSARSYSFPAKHMRSASSLPQYIMLAWNSCASSRSRRPSSPSERSWNSCHARSMTIEMVAGMGVWPMAAKAQRVQLTSVRAKLPFSCSWWYTWASAASSPAGSGRYPSAAHAHRMLASWTLCI
mmetsp:Transcript_27484/g.88161  ORF Transcript_27484/g.88161 Transcript_27484/m.88161 type:complete len:228 (+) Transcript_27484:46-729(+)